MQPCAACWHLGCGWVAFHEPPVNIPVSDSDDAALLAMAPVPLFFPCSSPNIAGVPVQTIAHVGFFCGELQFVEGGHAWTEMCGMTTTIQKHAGRPWSEAKRPTALPRRISAAFVFTVLAAGLPCKPCRNSRLGRSCTGSTAAHGMHMRTSVQVCDKHVRA